MTGFETVTIGGLPIAVADRNDAAKFMIERSRLRTGRPLYFTSANGEVIARCRSDALFRSRVQRADQILADGQSMVFASRLFCRKPLPERVATTDLFHDVAKLAEAQGVTFYLFGASPEENDKAVAAVRRQYPNLIIAGHAHGYLDGEALERKLAEINTLAPDILWLAMGVPREQNFVEAHAHRLDRVGMIKTSGGLFNFLSGKNKRAPQWMQNSGLEWVWRIILEPRRLFVRYLVTNPIATFLMITDSR